MRNAGPSPHPAGAVRPVVLLVALLAVPAVPAQAPDGGTSGDGLVLAELLPNPDPAQGQREFVELWNPGNASVELAGWTLRDAPTASGSANEFTFGALRLSAGARIVVWSNGSGDARGPSWSSSPSKTVWNDAGDAVTLLTPDGDVADWLAYGSSTATPPPGFGTQAKPAAPTRGLGLSRETDGSETSSAATWTVGAPTPGLAPGAVGGMATAIVVNVAPAATLQGVPSSLQPGEAVSVRPIATDGNGATDLASWTLAADGAIVASGTGQPSDAVAVTAPAASGAWRLEFVATDAGGLSDVAVATVQVRDARLAVILPNGVLRFPDLRPGDLDVPATDWAVVRNDGADAALPLLDVSPFLGPAGEIPVDGNLRVGLRVGGGNATWTDYDGPLTPLPTLGPGESLELSLRLVAVPAPLAAGSYGTTFAVVAA